MPEETKQCPYCAETIKSQAIVCRYCRHDLTNQPKIKQYEKKERDWIAILIVVILGVVLTVWFLAQLGSSLARTNPVFSEPTTTAYRVRYEVVGTAGEAFLTWENSQGGTEQGDYNIPYRQTFTFTRGDFAYISAQNLGETGKITCQIWVNNVKWKESTSTGAYSIATCSGSVGREW